MQHIKTKILTILLFAFASLSLSAQNCGRDVFVPISKYITQGDAESLSAWFSDNLEITILDSAGDSSRNQAKQILKTFFVKSAPTSFNIEHTASRGNMKYALGTLCCGAETFIVTIFVNYSEKNDGYKIQQLKLEKAR